MKYERLYLLLTKAVEMALSPLNFDDEQEYQLGHKLLELLNALGARLTYYKLSSIP